MTQDPRYHNQEDGFRTDLYGDEELVPFDVQDYSGRRAMRLLIIVFLLLLLGAFVVFKVYSQGLRDRGEPPLIQTDTSPYKVAPENPGGEVTPNQDKSVYDVMNGTARSETVTPAPQPEEPIDLPRSATIIVDDNSEPTRSNTPDPDPRPQTQTPTQTPSETPTRREVQAPTPARPSQINGSNHVVQVASVRTREDAEALWYQLKDKFAAELPNGSYADVRRVDLGAKGIYFRLRIAGLTDKNAASSLCNRFKARQQACFVTRK